MTEEAGVLTEALAFCRQSLVPRILPFVSLERGTGRVLAMEEGALLVYDPTFEGHMLCWDDETRALTLLRGFAAQELLMMERTTLEEQARTIHGFKGGMVCFSGAYLKDEPVPVKKPVRLDLLRPEHLSLVTAHNREAGEPLLKHALAHGRLYGGWVGDVLVGFIGFHEEGSLGMLYVLEEHRRRGYAAAMEGQLINRLLAEGKRVFGQIRAGNDASFALHRRMGYTIADEPGSWHWR